MTISVRQEKYGDNAGAGSTLTIVPTSAFVASNPGMVACTWEATTGTPTCSDTSGNTWSTAQNIIRDTGNAQSQCHFYCDSLAAASPTITVNFGSSVSFRGIYVAEFTGASATSHDGSNGQFQNAPGTGSNGVSSNTVTNAVQPALLNGVGFNSAGSSGAPNAGTGFTSTTTGWGFGGTSLARSESQRYTDTTGHAATFTALGNTQHLTSGQMFDEAAVGGSTIYNKKPFYSPIFDNRVLS